VTRKQRISEIIQRGDVAVGNSKPLSTAAMEPDNMPQAITATDPAGRWAVYVPLTRCGKIVVPRPYSETITNLPRD
jgi:hypothetical protein